ncbi:MAG: ABC transporter permease [Candidatus Bipolaricaulia bacterium]
MFSEFLRLALQSIWHRKLRSVLAVLGVLIGIMAVVLLISFGLSFQGMMTGEVSRVFGTDTFVVMEENAFGGGHSSGGLKQFAVDLPTLQSLEGVKTVAAIRQRTAFVQGSAGSDGKLPQGFFPVMGLSPVFLTEFKAFTPKTKIQPGGRNIQDGDVHVAILSDELAKRLNVSVGGSILVAGEKTNEITAAVIGIFEPTEEEDDQGFAVGMGVTGSDTIFIPNAAMGELWPEGNDFLVTAVRTLPGYEVDEVADRAEAALKVEGSQVVAITSGDITSVLNRILSAASIFLACIAGVSLVVGGVGVMNTMFTSVLERTKDIGVMKAVGAKNRHVLAIFLIESGSIGLLGGVVGTIAGLGFTALGCWVINTFFPIAGGVTFPFVASPILIVATLIGSFAVGALSGLWPARRGARMPVVDALRYE